MASCRDWQNRCCVGSDAPKNHQHEDDEQNRGQNAAGGLPQRLRRFGLIQVNTLPPTDGKLKSVGFLTLNQRRPAAHGMTAPMGVHPSRFYQRDTEDPPMASSLWIHRASAGKDDSNVALRTSTGHGIFHQQASSAP